MKYMTCCTGMFFINIYLTHTLGISKKLEKISKKKGFEKLQKWTRSIKNHIYWTAATSRTGPERVAKWTSFLNHVRDVHAHDDPLYPKCLHDIRRTRDKRKWLRAGGSLTNKNVIHMEAHK